jgi:hypothetical protein
MVQFRALTLGCFRVTDDSGALKGGTVVDVGVGTIVKTCLGTGTVDVVKGENARHGAVRRLDFDVDNAVETKLLANKCCLKIQIPFFM